MNKVKVIVTRRITETWEYLVDANALDIPSSSEGLTPAEHGDACDALHELINGTEDDALLSDEVTDSSCEEESIIEWGPCNDEHEAPQKKRGGFSC
jgi:hypothetical protein